MASEGRGTWISQIFQRLSEIPGYTWDTEKEPFHSSYDNWHFFGRRIPEAHRKNVETRVQHKSSMSGTIGAHTQARFLNGESTIPINNSKPSEEAVPVVARVSSHKLRLEREFTVCKAVVKRSDPECHHFIRPLEFIRLQPRAGQVALVVSISEAPGPNYLRELVEFGPNAYRGVQKADSWEFKSIESKKGKEISLQSFLHFAIGAATCCEVLHHQNGLVHGELRGDAFHLNRDTGRVKMINFGSGARSFEQGLTSFSGWSSLSREVGIEHKLQFIAPEQTGRLPAEPDLRTDIYSLGILFFTILTGENAFSGQTPLNVMQALLSSRLPPLTSKRLEVPEALSAVIQKMTQRKIDDRYHSTTGLKHDLIKIQNLLTEGDTAGLANFKIAAKDVSSFFSLPTGQIGRRDERQKIIDTIDRIAKRQHQPHALRSGVNTMSSTSSNDPRMESSHADDAFSESGSSEGRQDSRNGSGVDPAHANAATLGLVSPRTVANASSNEDMSDVKPLPAPRISSDHGRAASASINSSSIMRSNSLHSGSNESPSILLRKVQRLRRKGHCEIIAINGTAGLGKSCLVQSVQVHARSHGYFASTKFDQAKRTPFDPVLRLMSSIFRQIFSESDVSTEFHSMIRNTVYPVWGSLHAYLDLPAWLLDSGDHTNSSRQKSPPADVSRRASSPALQSTAAGSSGNTAADWLRSGGSNKSLRFKNTFLDVLRLLATESFIACSVDDLQFADSESLDLIRNIISSKIPILLIMTFRAEDMLPEWIRALLPRSTYIELKPFAEEETLDYVEATLHRDREYILPLAAVIQEKTRGNPFLIREVLDTCQRKNCIYYNWKDSLWEYDIDKIFSEFESQSYGEQINNDFITKKFRALAPETQSLLAWASMIGTSFSFSLIKDLMSGTYTCLEASPMPIVSSKDAVAGLEGALAVYIITTGDTEDRFRFSHDRYLQAAMALADDYSAAEMHFLIAQTMIKHGSQDNTVVGSKSLYVRSRHICLAADLIKSRLPERAAFRDVLYQAAEHACETGARETALFYYSNCLQLLQDDPWDESIDSQVSESGLPTAPWDASTLVQGSKIGAKHQASKDVNYQETLRLFTRTAECYWFQGLFEPALGLLQTTFNKAKDAVDKAPSWILQSRIWAIQGDSHNAWMALKTCLSDLGLTVHDASWEKIDSEQQALCAVVMQQEGGTALADRPLTKDRTLETIGPVLVELLSAAFWSNSLLFYQMTLEMVKLQLNRGTVPQLALGYLHWSSIVIGRFSNSKLGIDIAAIARRFLDRFGAEESCGAYTLGRFGTLYPLFIGHLETHIRHQIPSLNEANEASVQAGDRIMSLLNRGIVSSFRLQASDDLAEVEAYTQEAPAEYKNWQHDLRGGVLLISTAQFCKAMQGKTRTSSADGVLNDDNHDSTTYLQEIDLRSSNPRRPRTLYLSYLLEAQYRYGHFEEAIATGERLLTTMESLFCMRYTYSNLFFLSLSYIGLLRRRAENGETHVSSEGMSSMRGTLLTKIRGYYERIRSSTLFNDINYRLWLALLSAEIADVSGQVSEAMRSYEAALDDAELNNFTLDEGLAFELYAGSLIRQGAKRPAKRMMVEAISSYRRISALGKCTQLKDQYEWLLQGYSSLSTADAECQTTIIDTNNTEFRLSQNEAQENNKLGLETSADRTTAWLSPQYPNGRKAEASLPVMSNNATLSASGLDVIDLQGILEASQVLSSELKEDKLLSKMTEIILESTTADVSAIVVEDQTEWTVATVGTPDGVTTFPKGQPLQSVDDQIARQVTLYSLRFKEIVFVPNIIEDERFSNVPEAYLRRNPEGKAVICMPILHGNNVLLGSLYCEGPPNSFTERNVTVLGLLVNQIGISLANALMFKRIERVSASNVAMLDMQKQALAQARESENKAKIAEAIAIRNVQLKEEAARAKSLFLANVSHELRTPLNGVIGMSELLKASQMTTEQNSYADSIRTCADLLLSIINDLLDFSKLEAGKMNMIVTSLNLTETITEVVRALSYTNEERGLKTRVLLDDRLKDIFVLADGIRLHQVLMNLLSNAYKFTTEGAVTVSASVISETNDTVDITCSVADTGIGISKDQKNKLFLPFSQIESSSSRGYGGTGLGLSICKAIVSVMDGKIWLDSTPGVGTTVSFAITFKKVTETETEARGRDVNPMAKFSTPTAQEGQQAPGIIDLSTIPRDQLRICIAEDNLINQRIAISFVAKLGFQCEAFVDGSKTIEALERASREGKPFHLVLMDCQMPVKDGYDATRDIRRHPDPVVKNVLIIAMTASAIQGDREKCLEAGMNNYLAKPVR
ncbi:putative histidine kinase HHK1p [Pseudovirgaria hyperparasitica]|uniref:histidine kinase n=1 Tax=Pseudovirgaria hyperparasitica TaxID=470096 RepID=A0A6A6VV93_9PEZI|nr:putative histidine kinase HHK1p [Pseudovirgaria hyperparasitica]KAF2753706.1 putative histidine kinase HHK1p [Pseudovirgaria hyperparasitica]